MLMNKKNIALVLAFFVVASCSLSTSLDATIERDVESVIELRDESKVPSTPSVEDTVRVKDDIWLGDASVVEYEGEPLPSKLEKPEAVTLISNRPVSLYEIGDMVTKVTSLSVRFSSEIEEKVLTVAEKNAPSADKVGADWTEPNKMILSYRGALSGLLDEVASRFGLWWSYDKKTIHFYKQITKTFVVYSLPSTNSLSANVGGTSSGSGGSSSISLSSSAQIELWGSIEKTVTSMAGKEASVITDKSNGTITVTAKPTEIAKISKYINEQNVRLSRQVVISVKVLQVSIEDSDNYGLNLNAVFGDSGNNGLFTSDAYSTSTGGSNFAASILHGAFDFTAAVNALSKQGTTSLVTSGTVTSLNNKPAPIQVVEKQTYISEVTKTDSGGTSGSYDISVETEELETGFTLDVLPRILEHNRLMMLFNLTLSDLISLEDISFDDGSYVQNPKIESRGFSQEVAMKSGETLILTGFERLENTVDKAGVGSATNSLLGGSVSATKTRNVLVIMLTPVVLDSPLVPESRMKLN